MRRNGCPKLRFWRVRFFSAPLRFALKTPESLNGAEKKRTLQKMPFWTTVSPHDAFRLLRSFGAPQESSAKRKFSGIDIPKASRGHLGRRPGLKALVGPSQHCQGKEKQHKHKLFGPDFPRTFLTLTPGCPGVKKFLPTTGAAGKTHFLVRTSTIFGADVHDPKGCRKTLYKKSLR